jgi:hypothetical protein
MQRLELPSKIKNLFKYGKDEKGHTFDVVLVMNEDVTAPPVFVNPNNATASGLTIEPLDPAIVADELRLWTRTLTEVYIPLPEEPTLNAEYVARLNKRKQTDQQRLLRAKSHVRQWYYFRRCYDVMRENESKMLRKYDVMVRLRDDNFIVGPMDPGVIAQYSNSFPNTIIVSNCETWQKQEHAINDKGAIVSRHAAHVYFTAPLDFYYMYPVKVLSFDTAMLLSPEIWLNHVYNRINFLNMVQDVSKFPVMTYRRLPKELSKLDGCVSLNMGYANNWQLRCYTSGDEQHLIRGIPGGLELIRQRSCIPVPHDFIPWPDVFTKEERSTLSRLGFRVAKKSNFRPKVNATEIAAEHELAAMYRKRLAKIGDR